MERLCVTELQLSQTIVENQEGIDTPPCRYIFILQSSTRELINIYNSSGNINTR